MIFLVASVCAGLIYMQHLSSFPLQVTAFGFSNHIFGMLISINGLVVILFELPLTIWTKRMRPATAIAVGMILTGIGFALIGSATSIWLLVATVIIWSMGEVIIFPVAGAWVANAAPAHLRGRYHGAWTMTWGIANVLAPIIGTAVFVYNPNWVWWGCGLTALLATVLFVLATKDTAPETEVAGIAS